MNIDGVFSGGGIKGLALVGAYEAIEQRNLSFVRIAGTSAGALIAALVAAGYTSKELKEIVMRTEISSLLDSMPFDFPLFKWLRVYHKLGMYKGLKLEQWIENLLLEKGIRTFGDLPAGKLKIVTSDISKARILTIPDDLPYYEINPEAFSVARAVRMSCTLPYFFQPVKLKSPHGLSLIVDGGILSNFPIWLFDEEAKKKRPILGVKLSPQAPTIPKHCVKTATDLFGALIQTMKDAHDARYISKRHAKNIIFMPVTGTSTTDFNINDEKKHALINMGREYAEAFLKRWSY
ncbi:NTE family protein [Bacillus ectoiniformans]|uniref:patatin-like phospholipase family protein n=1 Tax=Bacillus ectoiniformans TaxID=1494429 RepID=UPI00195AF5DE|nr:patatin-like phospholipase family protein [Bacillus ectoiniformans]MBM7650451.1 NTE family protein [Bacillus ectoiniformans]